MDIDNLAGIIGGAIGAGAIGRWVETWLKGRQKAKASTVRRDYSYINTALNDILENTSAKQVLVMETHNGGKQIRPTSKIFSSCLYERFTKPYRPVKADLQNTLMSEARINLVLKAVEEGYAAYEASEVGDAGLSAIMKGQPTKHSVKCYIYDIGLTKIFYMICSTDENETTFSDSDLFIIKKNCRIIGKVLKKYE